MVSEELLVGEGKELVLSDSASPSAFGSYSADKASPLCPECNSSRVWRDGLRYSGISVVQRFLCRDCGFRFSDPLYKGAIALEREVSKSLKRLPNIVSERQICAIGEAKNLGSATELKTVAGGMG